MFSVQAWMADLIRSRTSFLEWRRRFSALHHVFALGALNYYYNSVFFISPSSTLLFKVSLDSILGNDYSLFLYLYSFSDAGAAPAPCVCWWLPFLAVRDMRFSLCLLRRRSTALLEWCCRIVRDQVPGELVVPLPVGSGTQSFLGAGYSGNLKIILRASGMSSLFINKLRNWVE